MKLRITNNAKGGRGIWFGGILEEVAAGQTRTFSGVTPEEIEEAVSKRDFRVQSSDDGDKWAELSRYEAPAQKPYIVIATDRLGGNYRVVELREGEWFIGSAIASERPEKATGYSYEKIGGESATAAIKPTEGEFDPEAVIAGNAPDVIDALSGLSAEQLELLKIAETDREKPRKGVITAIDEALATADNS